MPVTKNQDEIDVRDYGAKPHSLTSDDTLAIEAAVLYGAANRHPVYFPKGRYRYEGAGFDPLAVGAPHIFGESGAQIDITGDNYFWDVAGAARGFRMRGIFFKGGKGVFRQRDTGSFSNQFIRKAIEDCSFKDYTECAIASNSKDWGNWRIDNCEFVARDFNDTIGIALNRANNSFITRTIFHVNRYHIKLDYAGSEVHIDNCGFQWSGTGVSIGPRARIWLVPMSTAGSDLGENFTLINCRFGNENWDPATDNQILIAEQLAGPNETAMPDLVNVSTNRMDNAQIHSNLFAAGGGTPNAPVIYSTTDNVGPQGFSIYSNEYKGSRPGAILETLSGTIWPAEAISMFHAGDNQFYWLEPPSGGGPAVWA